ncbi:hypothetical protein OSB04_029277 [Centaurea solstitialis]|uniref:Uncharacterized protein n=1 Tax=Centaurea solstitialis TaxID=347529 RepID=A0AA38SU82_9ASTR|nr:hypothetical protein OSB04_029277 [Centaurea solstitialis]
MSSEKDPKSKKIAREAPIFSIKRETRSVFVILDVKALGSALAQRTATLVFPESGLRVGLAPSQKHLLGLLHVLLLPEPCLQGALLQGPAK